MKYLEVRNFPALTFDVQEALNQFRVNLSFCGDNIKTVMITSSVPNEGKSFIAMQLWKMMSEMGTKTLLIDADLRNSMLRSKYAFSTNEERMIGGLHYLAGQAELNDVIYKTNIGEGYIIPAIGSTVNPTMLLEGSRFSEMIDSAEKMFDFIIIDTPPLGSVADALDIATSCDGSVLIVRSGDTSRRLIKNSVQLLHRTSTPLLGVVLNRLDVSSSANGYYYKNYYYKNYYYKYGYGYGSSNKKDKNRGGKRK